MSDAQEHAAIRAAWKRYYGRSIEWQVSDPEHIAYKAGIVAGMRRAAEIAEPHHTGAGAAGFIRLAADKLEHEQEQR